MSRRDASRGIPENPDDLIDALLEGAELRAVMSPDSRLPFLKTEAKYLETVDLPFVVICDGVIWGNTRKSHVSYKPGESSINVFYFSYSPQKPYYGLSDSCSIAEAVATKKIDFRLLPLSQYSSFEFRLSGAYSPVWQLDTPKETQRLYEAIKDACRFRLAVKFNSGNWMIAPVNIPYWYVETSTFKVTTDFDFLPNAFINPRAFDEHLARTASAFLTSENPARSIDLKMPPIFTFVEFHSDGSYLDFATIPTGERKQAMDAILFAAD